MIDGGGGRPRPSAQTDGVWLHTGKLLVRSDLELGPPDQPPGQSATLVLPDGILTSAMLAQGAAQQQIGSYAQAVSWTMPTANVWTETPMQVNCTFTGVLTRFEFTTMAACPTKGQRLSWGIMVDGGVPLVALGAIDAPENNYGSLLSGTYYAQPVAGSHRVSLGLYGPAGSQLFNACGSALYVTEQRR